MSQVAVRTCSAGYGSVPDQVGRGGAQADRDLLALGDRGLPLPLPLVVVAPVLLAEHEEDVGIAASGHIDLLEAAQLPQHWPQALEAHVQLRHLRARAPAGIGDFERNDGPALVAACLERPVLELRVRQPEPERIGRRPALGVVPAVPHQGALREVCHHLVAPHVRFWADAWVLVNGEPVFVLLREGHGQAPSGGRLAREHLGHRDANLLPWHEQHHHRVGVRDPLSSDGARQDRDDDYLLVPALLPQGLHERLGLWE
mmetsp:Transcript_87035/g.242820  ORF Transcript_87035/g.242820 Transcript_87035/m.242820 type:complete len:258 (-) Transcript_87035:1692-2465(-)